MYTSHYSPQPDYQPQMATTYQYPTAGTSYPQWPHSGYYTPTYPRLPTPPVDVPFIPPLPLNRNEQIRRDKALAAALEREKEQHALGVALEREKEQQVIFDSNHTANPRRSQPSGSDYRRKSSYNTQPNHNSRPGVSYEIFIPPLPSPPLERTNKPLPSPSRNPPTPASKDAQSEFQSRNQIQAPTPKKQPSTILLPSSSRNLPPILKKARNDTLPSSSHKDKQKKTVSLMSPSTVQPKFFGLDSPPVNVGEPMPSPGSSSRASLESSSLSAEQHAILLRNKSNIFTDHTPCSNCKDNLTVNKMARSDSLSDQLHIRCNKCKITHCRGCRRPVKCRPGCSADSNSCHLRSCCRQGRSIAISEILGRFDKAYIASIRRFRSNIDGASPLRSIPKADRDEFLEMATSHADGDFTRSYNRLLKETVEQLVSWLPLNHSVHSITPSLLSMSFLLEVVSAYLKNDVTSHVNWIVSSPLYVVMINFLVRLCQFKQMQDLVTQPLASIEKSSGLQALLWDANSRWISGEPADAPLLDIVLSDKVKRDLTNLGRLDGVSSLVEDVEMSLYRLTTIHVHDIAKRIARTYDIPGVPLFASSICSASASVCS